MNKIAATVTLYNPNNNVIDNIESYLFQVEKIYAIDNSDLVNQFVVDKLKQKINIKYIRNNSNLGIATALNIGARNAIYDGFDYLLTMDQDSSAPEKMIYNLQTLMVSIKNAGIIAAEHFDPSIHTNNNDVLNEEVLFTMSSGNLISLSAFKIVGDFLDNLFIDHVDHEFCLRLNKFGYKVIKTNTALVFHKLGNIAEKKFLNRTYYPINHSPLRLYYRFRNRFYVNKIYKDEFPQYVKIDNKNAIRELLTILIFEKNRIRKVRMILFGYIHYKKNILGKFKTK